MRSAKAARLSLAGFIVLAGLLLALPATRRIVMLQLRRGTIPRRGQGG